ncbi:flagellar hook-associated protein FlgL [Paucibacter sp. APW11]|uniref:Flagellar hook-associated protein FlgL n=1 Tax=Roseateles aquae TaxID=3077235 RepID=A0ABU3P9R8_9BURK|nr:flagellar hook-associated protein FlgL [Paucibacter sp. APW11]MDT8999316.1 flagellar hook-associated protein FlgL [Paucibacter sp. APW11]
MRLSTANMFDASIANLQQRQELMQNAQQRLTSGKRVQTASDDPTGAARAERAGTAIGRVEANQRALDASRNGMTLSEGALGDANEILQQVRETMVSAGNSSYSDSERRGLASKIAELRNQLLSIANRPDGAGGYLFSGQGSSSPPFLDSAAGVRFNGVPGAIQTGNVDNFPLTVDGRQAWEQARTGNGSFVTGPLPNSITGASNKAWIDIGQVTDPSLLTGNAYKIDISGTAPAATYNVTNTTTGAPVASGPYLSGQAIQFDGISMAISGPAADGDAFDVQPSTSDLKIFDVLDKAVADLRTPNRSRNDITQSNALTLRDIDSAMNGLQNVRSQVGERLNNLDGTESRMASLKQYNQAEKSAAEDLDMTQGISDFQNQQTGYDAALKTYSMVQRMNLFQYLNP